METSEYEFLLSKGVSADFFNVFMREDGVEIELNMDDGMCKFRRTDCLCSLQCDYGEEKLFATCRAFPRSFTQIGTEFEAALDPACPSVAKLILNSEKLTFKTMELSLPYLDMEIDREQMESCFENEADFALFRKLSCDLIYHSDLSSDESLMLIGIFSEECDFPISHENFIQLVDRWSGYTIISYETMLGGLAKDEGFKVEFFANLYSLFLSENENMFGLALDATDILGEECRMSASQDTGSALDGRGTALDGSGTALDHGGTALDGSGTALDQSQLKSLLSNSLFLEKYPFSLSEPSSSPSRAFRRLALGFSFFVFIAQRTDLSLDKALYLYTRAVEHDVDFLGNALDQIEELGLWELKFFSGLVL